MKTGSLSAYLPKAGNAGKESAMRLVPVLAMVILLGGCALNWYQAPTDGPTARLRVVEPAGGSNTSVVVAQSMSCPRSQLNPWDGDDRNLGLFHSQFRSGGVYQAAERGFNRRLNMPDGSRWPPGFFAEHHIEADKPVVFRAHVFAGGTTIGSWCYVAGRVQLASGKDYELLASLNVDTEARCSLELHQLVQDASGNVSRIPHRFLDGPRDCDGIKGY